MHTCNEHLTMNFKMRRHLSHCHSSNTMCENWKAFLRHLKMLGKLHRYRNKKGIIKTCSNQCRSLLLLFANPSYQLSWWPLSITSSSQSGCLLPTIGVCIANSVVREGNLVPVVPFLTSHITNSTCNSKHNQSLSLSHKYIIFMSYHSLNTHTHVSQSILLKISL